MSNLNQIKIIILVLIIALFGPQDVSALDRMHENEGNATKKVSFARRPKIVKLPKSPKSQQKGRSKPQRAGNKTGDIQNEIETVTHFLWSTEALWELINQQDSLLNPDLSPRLTKYFIRMMSRNTDLTTSLNTIRNMLESDITSAQYFDLLVNLAYYYPKNIIQTPILNKMTKLSDSDLREEILLETGSILPILGDLFQKLAQCQSATGLSQKLLQDKFTWILRQGRPYSKSFVRKIDRIVELLMEQ